MVFRHMFAGFPPERENTSGARWNPPETPAIYASLEGTTAMAEADYYINIQPLRPRAQRLMYRISVKLSSVLDLSDWGLLRSLGVDEVIFATADYSASQNVGGAVEWLGHDGLLIPSARAKGTNLVIFPNQRKADHLFEALDSEEITR
jgi:RES domain-containing protein